MVDTLACHARDSGFESRRSRHYIMKEHTMSFSEQFTNDRVYQQKIVDLLLEIDLLKKKVVDLEQELSIEKAYKNSYYNQLQDIYNKDKGDV